MTISLWVNHETPSCLYSYQQMAELLKVLIQKCEMVHKSVHVDVDSA